MRYLLSSDIHEEFEDFKLPDQVPSDIDAVLIAGDIWTKGRAVRRLERIAEWCGVPIVATAGNHDYYGDSIIRSDQRMQEAATASQYDIRILNPGTTVIGDCRIIGATLWTDYRLRNASGDNWSERHACHSVMNDHVKIRWGGGNFRKVKPEDLATLHFKHRTYIEEQLAIPHEGQTLVMTHHAPSEMSVKFRGKAEMVDNAYASNLEGLILDHSPQVWVHGHTHNAEEYDIGETSIVSNPKGYPGQNPDFDFLRVYETKPDVDWVMDIN